VNYCSDSVVTSSFIMPPRRNTRPADNPQPLPRPGFQTVLNSLLAQRDAALGVTIPSQPIARWESSSQPEILWELLAERRRAGLPVSLSQEQNAAVEAAIAHIPPAVVNDTIVNMEEAAAASQGGSPALTVVSDEFWNALQNLLPAQAVSQPLSRQAQPSKRLDFPLLVVLRQWTRRPTALSPQHHTLPLSSPLFLQGEGALMHPSFYPLTPVPPLLMPLLHTRRRLLTHTRMPHPRLATGMRLPLTHF
jgi:hypothetical protein